MNTPPESTCSNCGKTYQPDLASGLGGGCPYCLARMLAQETEDNDAGGDAPPMLAAGDTLGGVEILAPLARGGMGVVYKARQSKLNRVVAIKVIDPKLAGVPEFTQRFEREARALAVLNHPNVVQVFDYGHEGGLCYLVMEWIDGTSLREILTAGHLSADDALRYVPQICDALEYAHAQGVVHRDIKPENILIDREGQLKIADFGIARMRGDDQSGQEFVTRAGQRMGTPHYMAPEQQKHTERVDHRADLYSLGVVFYEMLTGELPLGRFPTPSQRVNVDVTLDEVVLKTLEHDPNRRYQRASEIKQALTAPAAAAPAAVPANPAPNANRPRITAFAWWSIAFAVASLLVLWEMTRAWVASPSDLGPWFPTSNPSLSGVRMLTGGPRPFFIDEPYLKLLRPLSIASLLLAQVFGWLALWRVRRGRGHVTGSWLAITGMLTPLLLLAALLVFPVIPAVLEELWPIPMMLEQWLEDSIAVAAALVTGLLLLLGLRGLFRRLRRYAADPRVAAPVKSMVATFLVTGLVGAAVFAISEEKREARWLGAKLWHSLVYSDHNPAYPEPLSMQIREDLNIDMWRKDIPDLRWLDSNFFGRSSLYDLAALERFDYDHDGTNGDSISCWMPMSRNQIYLIDRNGGAGRFLDPHGYLWIDEFRLENGILTVDYKFPVWKSWSPTNPELLSMNATIEKDKEMLRKREERIRTEYGVEPDTLYRIVIPFEEVGPRRMDKEFWQSAERVDQR